MHAMSTALSGSSFRSTAMLGQFLLESFQVLLIDGLQAWHMTLKVHLY